MAVATMAVAFTPPHHLEHEALWVYISVDREITIGGDNVFLAALSASGMQVAPQQKEKASVGYIVL